MLAKNATRLPVPDYNSVRPEVIAACRKSVQCCVRMDCCFIWFIRKRLVYSGAPYGNGKLGDPIWESHHKSSARGACRARAGQTPTHDFSNLRWVFAPMRETEAR